MASSCLPKPGTEFGPCAGVCEHRDCADTRRIAATICPDCREPIGYGRHFYKDGDGHAHAVCLEERYEAEANPPEGPTSECPMCGHPQIIDTLRAECSNKECGHIV